VPSVFRSHDTQLSGALGESCGLTCISVVNNCSLQAHAGGHIEWTAGLKPPPAWHTTAAPGHSASARATPGALRRAKSRQQRAFAGASALSARGSGGGGDGGGGGSAGAARGRAGRGAVAATLLHSLQTVSGGSLEPAGVAHRRTAAGIAASAWGR